MMSGIRNEPPISISSPREISTSRPAASGVERQHQRAGGVVDDQRVLGAGQPRGAARGSDRCGCPGCRCRDRARGCCSRRRSAVTARMAAWASGARPRLVCRTTPVALSTGRRPGPAPLRRGARGSPPPSRPADRRGGSARRRASREWPRPPRARGAVRSSSATSGSCSSRSTEGSVAPAVGHGVACLRRPPLERVAGLRLEGVRARARAVRRAVGRLRLGHGQHARRVAGDAGDVADAADLHLVLARRASRAGHPEHELVGERRAGW